MQFKYQYCLKDYYLCSPKKLFMRVRLKIRDILKSTPADKPITVMGWVRTFRNNQFIALNDGSTNNNLQVVVDFTSTPAETLKRITTGAAIKATGILISSQGKG